MIKKFHTIGLHLFLTLTPYVLSPTLTLSQNSQTPPITARIIEGSIAASSLFPEVAEIFVEDGICSGTLISPDYVLTAGHCAYDDFGRVIRDMGQIALIVGTETRGAKSIHIHPKYNNNAEACTDGIPDASLIRLDAPIVNIAAVPLASAPPAIGEQLQIVGYGMLGSGRSGQNRRFPGEGELAYGQIQVDKVSSTFISWRFKANQKSSNTAGGDSGGPAFQTINGQKFLSAITCGGTGNAEWGTESYDTRVDILADWLNPFISQNITTLSPQLLTPKTLTTQAQKSFSFTLEINGAQPLNVSSSELPLGLRLENRKISGTPTVPGRYSVTFTAQNAHGKSSAQVTIIVKKPDTTFKIRESTLQFGSTPNEPDSFIILAQLKTLKTRFIRNHQLMLMIGNYQEAFPIGLSKRRSKKKGASLVVSRIAVRNGQRVTLNLRISLSRKSLFQEIRTLGFPELTSAFFGQKQILATIFEFAGSRTIINQHLSLDSADRRWHLVR